MADQAVQTMLLPPSLPELPEPAFVTPDDNLYTVHQMRAYARAALAAPAASGVDTSTNEAWAARAQEKIATMDAAASVSERARDDRFTAMLIGIIADVQDALGFTDEDKECSNGSLEIVAAIRELKEQALTQQRGHGEAVDRDAWAEALELPEGYTVEEFLPGGWHYAWTRADGERMVSGTTWNHPALAAIAAWQYAPATTPQPSADAVRELVRRAYEVVHHDDECPAIGGCGDKDCRCDAVPFLRELESLLSGGSHA